MRALLDTHALLWWLSNDSSLSTKARRFIEEPRNSVLVSAASAWEIAIKVRLGKLRSAEELVSDFSAHVEREGFEALPIYMDDAVCAGLLPAHHSDPFDRMLIAQAQASSIPILTNERIFDVYGVRRIW